jgi:DNA-binding HxlR family transcriptional regulator
VTKVGFEQATIKVENEATFSELKASIERALAAATVEKFLKRLESKGIRIRDFDSVLRKQVIEAVDSGLKKSGKTAKALYQELSVSDQAQMREFYLSKLETIGVALRHKFKKLYQYY